MIEKRPAGDTPMNFHRELADGIRRGEVRCEKAWTRRVLFSSSGADTMTLKKLPSGYWLARWNWNQFIQWPCNREARLSDGFGWITESHVREANAAIEEPTR